MFTFASLFFHIGWIGAQPLFNIYTIKVLGADETWLSAISIASAVSSIWAYTKWPKLADKKGNNVALAIAIIGMGITPLLYAICNHIFMLVIFNVLIGVSVAGTVLLLFNILLEIIPNENRTIYIAIYNTLIAIISGVSPLLAVKLMDMTNIYIALIAVAVVRLISSIFFYGMSGKRTA
jgi:MFS family permease